jgi:hypothetical protein
MLPLETVRRHILHAITLDLSSCGVSLILSMEPRMNIPIDLKKNLVHDYYGTLYVLFSWHSSLRDIICTISLTNNT